MLVLVCASLGEQLVHEDQDVVRRDAGNEEEGKVDEVRVADAEDLVDKAMRGGNARDDPDAAETRKTLRTWNRMKRKAKVNAPHGQSESCTRVRET